MKSALLVSLALLLPLAAAASGASLDTYHQDHRTSPKLVMAPEFEAARGLTPESTARDFLQSRAAQFQLPADLSNLELIEVRESLLGKHLRFQQVLNGLPVRGGQVIVSVAKDGGRVLRAYNNTYPVGPEAAFLPTGGLDRDAAYDAVWEYVRAHGELRGLPSAELVYSPEGATFRLNWLVDLDLSGPDGAWQARVDALSGQVVELIDSSHPRHPLPSVQERIAVHEGPLADRQAEFAAAEKREAARRDVIAQAALSRASGTGVVFDPDPRTTLRNNALQDNSNASLFTPAYFTRDLLDIQYSGGVYRLNGPWVNILDWDPPSTAPSTTTDGNWDRVRGVNSFNDAMTYFHLDQNQRYMQSLGFTGATGIQERSIGADTDGFNGADNSAFYPGTNRLTFGHGCVDDNEDADVILHEYGHAINHDINSSWFGGDTGAMGEGWGDYWGGSYSYGTENGPIFYPDWIYSWDGHGVGNPCWPGRVMNATNLQYVHSTTYGAHQSIPGGISDELWSTPIFQSLRTLVETYGESHESVDTILLEAQFGLGSGLKMRDMANVIIATAQQMYPDGPHAVVFVQKFLVHNIVLAPEAALGVLTFEITSEPSGNGAADPGETVDARVTLVNSGLSDATAVTGVLSTSTPGVTILQSTAAFPDVEAGGTGTAVVDYSFSVDAGLDCGALLQFALDLDFTGWSGPASALLSTQTFAGVPVGGYGYQAPHVALPDNDGNSVLSYITISGTGALVSEGFNMDIDVSHTYIGDLVMWLTSPSGTRAYLSLFQGGSADDIVGNYPNTLTPAQSFDRFWGEPLDGTWELMVRDQGANGTGMLNSWALYDITGYDCDTDLTAAPDGLPVAFNLGQNSPNPFNPMTEISFAVPQDAGLVRLEIFDVRGQKVRTLAQEALPAGQHTRTWNGRTDAGRQVASGVYFYRLSGNNFSDTRKMVVVQ
ncbi:MAG: proprotein convertase P-domain-containing protein [Candidatus Krumholzibacteriia bacterium]